MIRTCATNLADPAERILSSRKPANKKELIHSILS
jgi:hypothetical protein